MDYLDELENQSVYIIREAYKNFRDLALLWSIGKDSTVLLWLMKKAFLGKCPVPLLHIDTTFKIPEMIEYRDRIVQKEGLNLLVHTNEEAIKAGMNHEKGRMECCKALKTDALKQAQEKFKLEGLFLGIRGDEEGSRSKERVFSVRGNDSKWDYKNQAPELWDQYQTSCEPGTHVRINPLLHWREIDVWKYIQRENIPLIDLYFAKDGKRYRSLGCYPCTSPVESDADTIEKIIEELENSKDSERLGRAQDQESEYSMQKLRAEGYM